MAEEITLESLDERITALESKSNSGDYTLRYSGEDIDSLLDKISECGFECGRETVTVGKNIYYKSVDLNVSSPTKDTKVIAVLRINDSTDPSLNICLSVNFVNPHIMATLIRGSNDYPNTTKYIPTGTYYIDWIVVGR
jgi:hypothetical protein